MAVEGANRGSFSDCADCASHAEAEPTANPVAHAILSASSAAYNKSYEQRHVAIVCFFLLFWSWCFAPATN